MDQKFVCLFVYNQKIVEPDNQRSDLHAFPIRRTTPSHPRWKESLLESPPILLATLSLSKEIPQLSVHMLTIFIIRKLFLRFHWQSNCSIRLSFLNSVPIPEPLSKFQMVYLDFKEHIPPLLSAMGEVLPAFSQPPNNPSDVWGGGVAILLMGTMREL